MKNIDNRVRYTKKVLQEALLKILRNKNISEVTIKEICDEAHINRGTFYLHYSTPNDLLKEIEEYFIETNTEKFSNYFHNDYEANYLTGLFAGILENKELCKIIMGKNGNPKFLEKIKDIYRPKIVEGWCKEFPKYKFDDLNYVYDFIFTGSMDLILNWIENDDGLTAEELGNRLDRLGHYCHLAIPEFKKKSKAKKI